MALLTTVLLALLALLVLVVLVLAARRIWVMHVRPDSIQGSDLHMLKFCLKENTRAWGGFYFTVPPEHDFEAIAAAVRTNVEQQFDQPGNTFRLGVDLALKRYVTYADRCPDDIIDVVHDDEAFFATKDERLRELVFRIYPEQRLIGVTFDHTVFDGLRLFNEIIVPVMQSRPFSTRWLLSDGYYPLLSELLQIYTAMVMGLRWLTHAPMRSFEQGSRQMVVSHRFGLDAVKAAKRRNKAKFTSAMLGVWMHRLFRSVDPARQMIRVGVIIGMENPRFRNNYTIITVDAHRSDSEDAMVRSIDRQLKLRQFEVLPLYHLISTLEAQTLFKQRAIDYLFSPAFFHRGSGVSALVDDMFFYTVPVSTPIYSFACSIDDEVTISTTLNTPEVDLEAFAADATRQFAFADERWLRLERGSLSGSGRVGDVRSSPSPSAGA